jgi:hypothetical protein
MNLTGGFFTGGISFHCPCPPGTVSAFFPMTEHKFQCGRCGQRLAATSDEIGLAANCPTCGIALTIPPPAAVSGASSGQPAESIVELPALRPVSPKLAIAIAATRAFGLTYRDPVWVDAKGDEYTLKAIDGFFAELYRLTDLLHSMEAAGEISRLPDADELQAVRILLFEAVLHDKWSGSEADLKAFTLQGAPAIRVS